MHPKSPDLHAVDGTARRTPRPPSAEPVGDCPRGEPEPVRRAWRSLRRDFGDQTLQRSDRPALLLLARSVALADRCAAELAAAPTTATGSRGQVVVSGPMKAWLMATERMAKQLLMFNACPRARGAAAGAPPACGFPGGELLT